MAPALIGAGLIQPLLPQPGGFEGLAPVPVSLASYYHAVTECPQMCDPNLEPRAAGLPASGHMKEDEHSVLLVPEALRPHAKLAEHPSPIGEEPDDVLAASDRSLPNPAIRNPLGVRMRKFRDGLRVTFVHRLVEPPHDLHVLLRHRPRSIRRSDRGGQQADERRAPKGPPRARPSAG